MKTYRILIADDEPEHLETMLEIVESSGESYEVLQALNGRIAAEIASRHVPDLIITDWQMPEMDGLQLIQKLKENMATQDIPIVMCTGVMITPVHLDTALSIGAVDFIRKPIDRVEFLARVRTMLRLADAMSEIKKQNRELARHIEMQREKLIKIAEALSEKNQVIARLYEYAPPDLNTEQTPAEKVLHELQDSLSAQADWSSFKEQFNQTYPEFLGRLSELYPTLTHQELKVCALVKIGLSTRQIANLLFLSKRSIDTHRYNVRKKLNLSPETDLGVVMETV